MENKTPQELEFRAWGLSKIAVRNIVVFFILTLLSAIGVLSKTIVFLHDKKEAVEQALIRSNEEKSKKIEELKNENLQTYLKLHEVLIKQEAINKELVDARETLKTIQKRLKR